MPLDFGEFRPESEQSPIRSHVDTAPFKAFHGKVGNLITPIWAGMVRVPRRLLIPSVRISRGVTLGVRWSSSIPQRRPHRAP